MLTFDKKTCLRMRLAAVLAVLIAASLTAGCGGGSGSNSNASPGSGSEAGSPPILTASSLGEQALLSIDEYLAEEPYATADRQNGERQAQVCRACHSLEEGGANMLGPNLHGFFGSRVGQVGNFDYSQAIREADFEWTPRALDAWLQQPARFLPGNRMTFIGVQDADDRADLIAYLLETT